MGRPKKAGKLICVCNQAIKADVCNTCPKYLAIKPDATILWPTWERRVNGYLRKSTKLGGKGPPTSAA